MELSDRTILVTLFALTIVLIGTRRGVVAALIEALQNFRGGPPTGMHPSPADDAFLSLRRHR